MRRIYVTQHAIARYQERVRACSKRNAIAQIRAIYAMGKATCTLPSGDQFHQLGNVRIVVDPLGRVTTLYTIKGGTE